MENLLIVNNTKADLSLFHSAIIESVKLGKLVEELADLFTMEIVKEADKVKAIINWA